MLRLADLLAEESFGLELLSGGPEAGERAVRGAHAVEVEAPTRWLGRDWVMLTTGVRLRDRTRAQRALVPELVDGGVSALGFGIGLGFERVPKALLEAAREHGFPVFSVPYDTPFREIIRFVDGSLSSGDEQLFRRLTALQRYLVDALGTPQPERAMVDRLASFLDASVLLVDADGAPEIVAGRAPAGDLLEALGEQPSGLVELEVDGWRAVVTPVAAQPGRRLVLASPRRGFVGKLAKPAAEATAPLLGALARLSDVVRDQELAVKAALLEEALEPAETHDPLPLAARAAAFGLDFAEPARMVVVRSPLDLGGVRRELVAALEHARVPHLVHARDGALAVLAQGAGVEAALAPVWDALPDVEVGIGRPVRALAEAHHSLRDAELAAARPGARVTRFEDFDLTTFMVSEIAPDRLGPKVDEILATLRANPPLREAISAYFAHDLDVAATAAALHMHRNSLRYRLARAEQVLGLSLKRPATIAAIHIALVSEAAAQNRRDSLDGARLPAPAGRP